MCACLWQSAVLACFVSTRVFFNLSIISVRRIIKAKCQTLNLYRFKWQIVSVIVRLACDWNKDVNCGTYCFMFRFNALTARHSVANKHPAAGPSGFQPKITLLQAAWSWSLVHSGLATVHMLLFSVVETHWKTRWGQEESDKIWQGSGLRSKCSTCPQDSQENLYSSPSTKSARWERPAISTGPSTGSSKAQLAAMRTTQGEGPQTGIALSETMSHHKSQQTSDRQQEQTKGRCSLEMWFINGAETSRAGRKRTSSKQGNPSLIQRGKVWHEQSRKKRQDDA